MEIWRDIPSLLGCQASSDGKVRVVPYTAVMPKGGMRTYGGAATLGQWDGDRYIWPLRGKTYRVARLVCEAFNGPSSEEKNVCMHLDENSRNNSPDNLAWGTQKENLNAPGFIAYCHTRIGKDSPILKGRKAKAER